MSENATEDTELVAFNATDADFLLAMIEAQGGHAIVPSPRRRAGIRKGRTMSGGLAAESKGNVFLRTPIGTSSGWEDSTTQIEVWNDSVNPIAGGKKLILIPIDGRFCAYETCD